MCEHKIKLERELYVCHHHKLIWKREPLSCKNCEILQQYSKKELQELLGMGYRLAYPDYR